MELEEETSGIDTMDDNDTTDDNPEASYEEWLVKELNHFDIGAVTNLKVGNPTPKYNPTP